MLEDAQAVVAKLARVPSNKATLMLAGELAARQDQDIGLRYEGLCTVSRDSPPATQNILTRLARIGPLGSLRTLLKIRRRGWYVDKQLKSIRPDVLIVFEDRVIDPEMIWLDRAGRLGISSVLVRYASSSAESDAWTRRDKAAYSLDHGPLAWARRLFARAYPAHALDLGMGRQIFYSLWDSLALAMAGMAGAHPWVVGGGRVTIAAVQGQADLDEAERLVSTAERFHVTGQPSWDAMVRIAGRECMPDSLRRGPAVNCAPRLICALPQWGEHLQMPWSEHVGKIEQLCAILQRSGFEAVLSLHPKAERERYQSLADRHNLQIAQQPLSEILPMADIFVASWSSTLRWSAMLGIPSINLDWAGQGYTLFAELTSLPMSRTPGDLEPLLSGFANDATGRQALGERLRKESSVYGTIDGQAGQRILSLIENLVARGNNG
jgi:hypothetical protein